MTVISQYLPLQITATTAAVMSGQMNAALFYWYDPISVGDQVVFQDQNGAVVWQGRAEVASQSQVFRCPRPISIGGWQVPTISSGTLFVYSS